MSPDDTPHAVLTDPAAAVLPEPQPLGTDDSSLPERRCILTGAHGARDELIRLALGPDGAVWPDLAARLPGRGAWISADRALLENALAKGKLKGALARAFKDSPPCVPADLADRIATGLQRRALDRLGLEHRAGHLVFGSDRLSETARAGRLSLLLHAGDAADDGCSKLNQAFRAGDGSMEDVLVVPVGRDALSAALGRENIVHSGVTDGRAAARVKTDLARWIAYLGTQKIEQGGGHMASPQNDEGRA